MVIGYRTETLGVGRAPPPQTADGSWLCPLTEAWGRLSPSYMEPATSGSLPLIATFATLLLDGPVGLAQGRPYHWVALMSKLLASAVAMVTRAQASFRGSGGELLAIYLTTIQLFHGPCHIVVSARSFWRLVTRYFSPALGSPFPGSCWNIFLQ